MLGFRIVGQLEDSPYFRTSKRRQGIASKAALMSDAKSFVDGFVGSLKTAGDEADAELLRLTQKDIGQGGVVLSSPGPRWTGRLG